MRDPCEGLTPDGYIVTGAHLRHVASGYLPVVRATVRDVQRLARATGAEASLYLYGSVATGAARAPMSDVDFASVGLSPESANQVSKAMSRRFRATCREVAVGTSSRVDCEGETDAAYGARVFLRHYCVHLAGPDVLGPGPAFLGDARAARGFNGDVGHRLREWRSAREATPPAALGRRLARKTLLALASLTSVRDGTWTTDRETGARRWTDANPQWGAATAALLRWSEGTVSASDADVATALAEDGVVESVVRDFEHRVGLWP